MDSYFHSLPERIPDREHHVLSGLGLSVRIQVLSSSCEHASGVYLVFVHVEGVTLQGAPIRAAAFGF